jgi:hypothetical protein
MVKLPISGASSPAISVFGVRAPVIDRGYEVAWKAHGRLDSNLKYQDLHDSITWR